MNFGLEIKEPQLDRDETLEVESSQKKSLKNNPENKTPKTLKRKIPTISPNVQ